MVSRLASGAAVDRYESDRQRHTAVINLDTTKNRRVEEESRSASATTAEYGQEGEEEEYEDYYYEDEYEDGLSGDYVELPRSKGVCHFSNFSPLASSTNIMKCNFVLFCCRFSCHGKQTQRSVSHPGDRKQCRTEKERKGKKEGEGKGQEEESLPEEVQRFLHSRHLPVPEGHPRPVLCVSISVSICTPSPPLGIRRIIHRFALRPVCRCHTSYSGERCQFFTLPLEKPQEGYNRTTALAVVAVVLSSVCLTIIGLLLLLR